jgi:hypothetical protein
MKTKLCVAIAMLLLGGGAFAQSAGYTPTAREAQVARENTARDMKLADAMEKARMKEEAKPVAAYIPKEKVQKIEEHKPEVYVARVPGPKKKAPKKKAG